MLLARATLAAIFGAVSAIFAVFAGVARIGTSTRCGEDIRKRIRVENETKQDDLSHDRQQFSFSHNLSPLHRIEST
jgi:hypothetical protein